MEAMPLRNAIQTLDIVGVSPQWEFLYLLLQSKAGMGLSIGVAGETESRKKDLQVKKITLDHANSLINRISMVI